LIGGDYKHGDGLRIWNVYHTQVPPSPRFSEGHPGTFPAGSIFKWTSQNILHLDLFNAMAIDVRFVRFGVTIEADLHSPILEGFPPTPCTRLLISSRRPDS